MALNFKKQVIDQIEEEKVLMRLMVPKNNDKTPAAAELMFAAIHGIFNYASKTQNEISFEIVSINKFIQFYFCVPKSLKEFVEGQFYAQYPTVEISTADDYVQKITEQKYAVGYDIYTTKDEVYPIRTFQNFDVDPLSAITSIMSQLDASDEIWVQICVSPLSDAWQKKATNFIKAIKSGRDPNEPMWKAFAKGFIGAAKSVSDPSSDPNANRSVELSGMVTQAIGGIETKAAKIGFATKIRVVSLSPDYAKAKQRAISVAGGFKQFNTANMNGFIQGNFVEGKPIIDLYAKRTISPNPYVLNIEELASLFHLPNESVATPSMDWAGSRKGEPPQNLPIVDDTSNQDITLVGKTSFRNEERHFGIKVKDRALHTYAIGKTGTGKSTLLSNLIVDDIVKGRGVAVVDPHGDLINDVMEFIPQDRIDDVVFFAPADRNFPIGFNLLESVDEEYKNIVASGIVGIFKKIFGESWGPRLEYILRNVVLGLLDYPGATMLSILKVLTDTKFRRGVIDKISDPVIKDFFLNEYEKYDQKFRTEAVAPIQNKVGQFLSSTVIRNIVGQQESSINIRKIMDEGKILLIDLSIGKIGEDNSALLGSMLITKIQMAAMSRADMAKDQRKPFYLYVDEFQNFATDSFAVILSEARKYGLSLMMTNQYIAQMPETVSNAVFGNVGTIISFRVGAQDAESLQREFMPVFEATDLVNQNNHNIYIKMAIDGVTSAPFSAKTILPIYPKSNFQEQIIAQSRAKYSRPRDEVESSIIERTDIGGPTEGFSKASPGDNTESENLLDYVKDDVKLPAQESPVNIQPDVQKESPKIEPERNNRPSIDCATSTNDDGSKDVSIPDGTPEGLENVKMAEDYDVRKWYFLTRTGYKTMKEKGFIKDIYDENCATSKLNTDQISVDDNSSTVAPEKSIGDKVRDVNNTNDEKETKEVATEVIEKKEEDVKAEVTNNKAEDEIVNEEIAKPEISEKDREIVGPEVSEITKSFDTQTQDLPEVPSFEQKDDALGDESIQEDKVKSSSEEAVKDVDESKNIDSVKLPKENEQFEISPEISSFDNIDEIKQEEINTIDEQTTDLNNSEDKSFSDNTDIANKKENTDIETKEATAPIEESPMDFGPISSKNESSAKVDEGIEEIKEI